MTEKKTCISSDTRTFIEIALKTLQNLILYPKSKCTIFLSFTRNRILDRLLVTFHSETIVESLFIPLVVVLSTSFDVTMNIHHHID